MCIRDRLKAAIKLKAVSYVEKPLDMEELKSALREAVKNCQSRHSSAEAARLQVRSQQEELALLLTERDAINSSEARALAKSLSVPEGPEAHYAALVLDSAQPFSSRPSHKITEIRNRWCDCLNRQDLIYLPLLKADHLSITFFCSSRPLKKTVQMCIRDSL